MKEQKRIESLNFQLSETEHETEPSEQELRKECNQIESDRFSMENRLALLKSGDFKMETKSIFGALFECMKEKEFKEQQVSHRKRETQVRNANKPLFTRLFSKKE